MKKFLTFVTVAGIMILASGCEIHTRTVFVPKKSPTTVVIHEPTPTVVVYEEEPYIEEEIVIIYEPSYTNYCEYVDWFGDEECCYDYDVQEVWLSPYEYVYEVCEYTTCVDYDFNILTEDSVNCWYE